MGAFHDPSSGFASVLDFQLAFFEPASNVRRDIAKLQHRANRDGIVGGVKAQIGTETFGSERRLKGFFQEWAIMVIGAGHDDPDG